MIFDLHGLLATLSIVGPGTTRRLPSVRRTTAAGRRRGASATVGVRTAASLGSVGAALLVVAVVDVANAFMDGLLRAGVVLQVGEVGRLHVVTIRRVVLLHAVEFHAVEVCLCSFVVLVDPLLRLEADLLAQFLPANKSRHWCTGFLFIFSSTIRTRQLIGKQARKTRYLSKQSYNNGQVCIRSKTLKV